MLLAHLRSVEEKSRERPAASPTKNEDDLSVVDISELGYKGYSLGRMTYLDSIIAKYLFQLEPHAY